MNEEDKKTQSEELPNMNDVYKENGGSVNDEDRPKTKLDYKVLTLCLVGIGLVFGAMMFVNGVIFSIVPDKKTSYYISIGTSNVLFLILILSLKAAGKVNWAELGWKAVPFRSSVISVIKIWGLTWLLHIIYIVILFYSGIEAPVDNELAELLQKPTLLVLLANIFLIAVVAPVVEETIFRGFLFGSLRTYFGCWTAIVISAAIFSALHFQLVGFVPRFVLGICLGYLYVKHKSIYPSMGLHALNNFVAVIIVSLYSC